MGAGLTLSSLVGLTPTHAVLIPPHTHTRRRRTPPTHTHTRSLPSALEPLLSVSRPRGSRVSFSIHPSYFHADPNNFFLAIANRWFDTTIDGTYYHLRFFPQQTGMHVMRKMEDGELDISPTGNPPWAVGVARGIKMTAFYYVHG